MSSSILNLSLSYICIRSQCTSERRDALLGNPFPEVPEISLVLGFCTPRLKRQWWENKKYEYCLLPSMISCLRYEIFPLGQSNKTTPNCLETFESLDSVVWSSDNEKYRSVCCKKEILFSKLLITPDSRHSKRSSGVSSLIISVLSFGFLYLSYPDNREI